MKSSGSRHLIDARGFMPHRKFCSLKEKPPAFEEQLYGSGSTSLHSTLLFTFNFWLTRFLLDPRLAIQIHHRNMGTLRQSGIKKCVKVKIVSQSCLTLCNPMDCSSPRSSVHGILQARILEWVAIPFSRVCSWPRNWTWISCNAGRFFTIWATREAQKMFSRRKKSKLKGEKLCIIFFKKILCRAQVFYYSPIAIWPNTHFFETLLSSWRSPSLSMRDTWNESQTS